MRLSVWIRDLHEEGIHPHPGPKVISKNINGMTNDVYPVLKAIARENETRPLTAVFIQDHRIPRSGAKQAQKTAAKLRLLLILAHGPKDSRGVTYGGTAIVIPYSSIPHDSYRNAVLSFLRTLKIRNLARRYGGKPPVTPKKSLRQILSKLGCNADAGGAQLSPTLERLVHNADSRREEQLRQTG